MYHFLSAMVDGPGYLPLGWKPKEVFNFTYFSLKMLLLKYLHLQGTPEELVNLLQWCSECAGYKAPRAHHCRKCGRCKIEFVFNQIQMSTFSQILNHVSIPQVCSKDGPPLPLDKQLCRPFQPWTLFRLSHICCSGVFGSIFRMINYYHLMSPATLSVNILIKIELQVQSLHCVLKHEPLLWAQQKLVPVLWNRSFSFFLLYLAFVHILLCEIIK